MNHICRKCKECFKDMACGAVKCDSCGAYQDWTRYVFRWSTVGGAFLTVVPLWGIVLTIYGNSPNIKTANLVCEGLSASIDVYNEGDAFATVTKAFLSPQDTKENPIGLVISDGNRILGQHDKTTFSLTNGQPPRPICQGCKNCTFTVTLHFADFDGDSDVAPDRSCKCPG